MNAETECFSLSSARPSFILPGCSVSALKMKQMHHSGALGAHRHRAYLMLPPSGPWVIWALLSPSISSGSSLTHRNVTNICSADILPEIETFVPNFGLAKIWTEMEHFGLVKIWVEI